MGACIACLSASMVFASLNSQISCLVNRALEEINQDIEKFKIHSIENYLSKSLNGKFYNPTNVKNLMPVMAQFYYQETKQSGRYPFHVTKEIIKIFVAVYFPGMSKQDLADAFAHSKSKQELLQAFYNKGVKEISLSQLKLSVAHPIPSQVIKQFERDPVPIHIMKYEDETRLMLENYIKFRLRENPNINLTDIEPYYKQFASIYMSRSGAFNTNRTHELYGVHLYYDKVLVNLNGILIHELSHGVQHHQWDQIVMLEYFHAKVWLKLLMSRMIAAITKKHTYSKVKYLYSELADNLKKTMVSETTVSSKTSSELLKFGEENKMSDVEWIFFANFRRFVFEVHAHKITSYYKVFDDPFVSNLHQKGLPLEMMERRRNKIVFSSKKMKQYLTRYYQHQIAIIKYFDINDALELIQLLEK